MKTDEQLLAEAVLAGDMAAAAALADLVQEKLAAPELYKQKKDLNKERERMARQQRRTIRRLEQQVEQLTAQVAMLTAQLADAARQPIVLPTEPRRDPPWRTAPYVPSRWVPTDDSPSWQKPAGPPFEVTCFSGATP